MLFRITFGYRTSYGKTFKDMLSAYQWAMKKSIELNQLLTEIQVLGQKESHPTAATVKVA